jgi:hypothetical protein
MEVVQYRASLFAYLREWTGGIILAQLLLRIQRMSQCVLERQRGV